MFNVDQLGTSCAFKIGSTCYGAPFTPTPMSLADCNSQKVTLGIAACLYDGDYWAGAVSTCGGTSKIPTNEQLDELANNLFGVSNCGQGSACGTSLNYTLASSYGLPSSGMFFLWSSMSQNGQYAYDRYFRNTDSARQQYDRNNSTLKAVCVGN